MVAVKWPICHTLTWQLNPITSHKNEFLSVVRDMVFVKLVKVIIEIDKIVHIINILS